MSLNAKTVKSSGGGKRQDPMEAGTYPARVLAVVDLGTQKQRPYKGVEKPPRQEVLLTYEFSDEFIKDEDGEEIKDSPRVLSEWFPFHNLTVENAKSTARYKALDSTDALDGDFTLLPSAPCLVTINAEPGSTDKNTIFNSIIAVSTMRKKEADVAPPLVNKPLVVMLSEPCVDAYYDLPTFIQKKIKEALDFEGSVLDLAIKADQRPEEERGTKAKPQENKPEEKEETNDKEDKSW